WVVGADPDGAGPLLGSGATIHHVSTASGAAGNNVTVTISANNIDIGGVLGGYTVSWTSAGGATFNRFTLKDEGAGKFDVGRVDLIQGVASHTPVGGNLILQDDGPTLSGTTVTKAVGEDALSGVAPDLSTGNPDSGDTKTDKVSYSYAEIASIVNAGTDSPALSSLVSSFAANTAVKDINGNAITSGGDVVYWAVSGGVVQGVTAANRVIFTITNDTANSEYDVDLNDQIDHHDSLGAPLGDEGVTTLNLTPAFSATDKDLDPVTLTGNLVKLDVENDVPIFTAQIASKTLDWVQNNSVTSTLNGKAGADDPASYIIDKYTDLAAYTETLSADGKTLTYSQGGTTFFTLALNDSANSGAGSYTFTVNQPPPLAITHFSFLDLPSGQNLQSVIAKDKTNVDTHGTATLADGTYTNTSGTINTSKGGGDVTIGNTNQAFDHPGEGAWFVFVDNPLKSDVGGYGAGQGGIDQTTADDADTIGFTGFIESHDSSVKIVQASGKGTTQS